MDLLSPEILIPLLAVAAIAGFIDAISGGGGLLTLPALLWAGVPPLNALATNKLQGSFGTFAASMQFIRKKQITIAPLLPAILFTFAGSVAGSWSVSHLPDDWLKQIIPILLICFSLYFLVADRFFQLPAKQHISMPMFGLTIGFCVGFYDGFFGPGTGAFFVTGFVILMGYSLTRATGGTKLLNLTSNLGALIWFGISGHVFWLPGILLGLAQMAGAWLGAHTAIKHGDKVIKPLLVTVAIIVAVKLLYSQAIRP